MCHVEDAILGRLATQQQQGSSNVCSPLFACMAAVSANLPRTVALEGYEVVQRLMATRVLPTAGSRMIDLFTAVYSSRGMHTTNEKARP